MALLYPGFADKGSRADEISVVERAQGEVASFCISEAPGDGLDGR